MTKRRLRWRRVATTLGTVVLALLMLSQAPETSVAQDGPQIRVEKSANPTEVPGSGGWVTYQVKVRNESAAGVEVTLVELADSLYGDLTDSKNKKISSSTCSLENIQPGDTYKCSFEAQAEGSPGSTVTDSVRVTVWDDKKNEARATAEASVKIRSSGGGEQPAIAIEKSAKPNEVKEPGGKVVYQVKVRNEGSEAVTVTQMKDSVYGDLIVGANSLVSKTNCDLETIEPGATYKCEFEAEAVGKAGDTVRDEVRVRVKDSAGDKAEASAHATVTITGGSKPVLKIHVEKSANPKEVREPGGKVVYQVKVRNEGSEAVTVTQMKDSVYGDLIVGANSLVNKTTCDLKSIEPGTTYTCEFEAEAVGKAGDSVRDEVRVRVKDAAGNKAEASAHATVTISGGSKPVLKIRVEKEASPKEVLEPGEVVTYYVKVRNEGSESVTMTQIQDSLYGDLAGEAKSLVSYTSCDLADIKPGATYQCEFDAEVLGKAGTKVTDTVRVRVKDAAGNKTEASAEATVRIVSEVPDTGVPLPPPVIAGGLLALGAAAMGAGTLLQSWGRRAR